MHRLLVCIIVSLGAMASLPAKKELPLNGDTFCKGLQNVKKQMLQKLDTETAILCSGGGATDMLQDLLDNPYAGTGAVNLRTIKISQGTPGIAGDVQVFVAYSLKAKKDPVKMLLAEENLIKISSYNNDGFKISYAFDTIPPVNEGDSDTAFRVIQRTEHHGDGVEFDDFSSHDLKLYRMFDGNFDYMMAGRSLIKPTGQIRSGAVIRGVMRSPDDEDESISFTVVNFVMNGRNPHQDKVVNAFVNYIKKDVGDVYQYHAKN